LQRPKLSVFIITKDEQDNIGRCLDSVHWTDEIVIVDSFSHDKTVEICKKYTNLVYQRAFTDFADTKNFAISKTTGHWLLSVDADEEVTKELKDEILQVISNDNQANAGFYIKRSSRIFGRWFGFSGTQDDYQMRLFKRDNASYTQPVHEKVMVRGGVGRLKGLLLHYTYEDIGGYIKKMNQYTSMEADMLASNRSRVTTLSLFVKPPMQFLRLYILKKGFRDGVEGFIFCLFSAVYVFVKYSKILECSGRLK
jgi:glycosyltransferase involved in cell wall biosynthesis